MYRIRSTGVVHSQGDIRKMYSNMSLPAVWSKETCDLLGIDPVLPAPQPTPDVLETVVKDGAVQDANGNWVENWVVRPMFTQYTDENNVVHTKEEQEAAYLASRREKQLSEIRRERDRKLRETDWTQLPDVAMSTKADWATYRQALRDVPSQADPFNVLWPTEPA